MKNVGGWYLKYSIAENLIKDRNLKKERDHFWIFNSFKGGEACRMVIIVFNNCLGK